MSSFPEMYLRTLVSDLGVTEGSEGLAYQQDSFTGTGIQTVFNLSHTPNSSYSPVVYFGTTIQGTIQESGYTIAGSVLTFTAAPVSLQAILVVYSR